MTARDILWTHCDHTSSDGLMDLSANTKNSHMQSKHYQLNGKLTLFNQYYATAIFSLDA